MKIEVCNWKKYVKRGDITRPTWFAFPVSFFSDPELMGVFTPNSIAVFSYICSHATRSDGITTINFKHAQCYIALAEEAFTEEVRKLETLQLVAVHVTAASRGRTESVLERTATRTGQEGQEVREQAEFDLPSDPEVEKRVYDTDHELASAEPNAAPALPKLAALWNEHADKVFARVIGCNSTRAKHARNRWKEHPHEEFWIEIIQRMGASAFLTGRVKAYKAGFDFLIKPETANKVLEGTYDDGRGTNGPGGGQGPQKRPNTWFKKQVEDAEGGAQ